jgi:hypothetical protein
LRKPWKMLEEQAWNIEHIVAYCAKWRAQCQSMCQRHWTFRSRVVWLSLITVSCIKWDRATHVNGEWDECHLENL